MLKSFLEKHSKAINDAKWILGITILVLTLIYVISAFLEGNPIDLGGIIEFVLILFCPFIAFLPAEILIIVIFKIIKSENWKIFWAAFLIPYCNMIYYICEFLYEYENANGRYSPEYTNSEFLGAYSLYIFTFLAFITMCIPKSKLNYKKQIIKCLALMIAFGWLLIYISYQITAHIK